ncbi:MAG TPA: ROK family protein [Acidimicrobiales bacterium]|nr:ROK family protein [Acidimicrobiales bacterium]
MTPRLVAGLDLGGTKLLGAVVDAAGDAGAPLLEARIPNPHGGPEVLFDALGDMVAGLRARAQAERGVDLVAVGLGAPGLVDRAGVLRFGANLPGVVDVDFAHELRRRTGLPVAVDNDATCAAWAEHERGASVDCDNSVLVTLGTGIGAGIVVNGAVFRGAHGFAGEPGHMTVDPDGPECTCGRRGCWERYASGSGLARLGQAAARAGHSPLLVTLAGGEASAVRGEHVTQAAAEGDRGALGVLAEVGHWLGLGIANLVNVLDPEVVVVAGGLVEAGDLILAPARGAYHGLVYGDHMRPTVPIRAAQLGERAGAIGAALLADEAARGGDD